MNTLPKDWAPGRPAVERIARWTLNQWAKGPYRWDLTDPDKVRAAIATSTPGHILQDVLTRREALLAEEKERVRVVMDYFLRTTEDAIAELEEVPGV